MQPQQLFAAIDLGSNSFRLEIGRLENGHLRRVEYIKETVRQGNGLDAERNLSHAAMQRGWDCLARFAERIADFDPQQVRAVATQTLREARNREVFLIKAKTILGFPIEVIAGREEARLIYLGVSHLLPPSDERRLVIDIGGRSTELILGQRETAHTLASYRLGSVGWSMKYFADGLWTASAFQSAEIAAKAVLDEAPSIYAKEHWDTCYGSSGTAGAISDILTQAGWPAGVITPDGLDWLQEKLIKAHKPEHLKLDGLKDDRRPVIGGGLSVLRALFDLLQIQKMHTAQGALRHGALYDLIDRETPQNDVRTRMVSDLSQRFGCDTQQANRVARTAHFFLEQMHQNRLCVVEHALAQQTHWAAQLHEVGMRIAHSDYHKHGAYVLDNTDMPGFTLDELHRLSQLVLGHRGKLRKLEANWQDPLWTMQLMALRLSVILCHARRDPDLGDITLFCDTRAHEIRLHVSTEWSERWPQSIHLLRQECTAWQKTGWTLHVVVS